MPPPSPLSIHAEAVPSESSTRPSARRGGLCFRHNWRSLHALHPLHSPPLGQLYNSCWRPFFSDQQSEALWTCGISLLLCFLITPLFLSRCIHTIPRSILQLSSIDIAHKLGVPLRAHSRRSTHSTSHPPPLTKRQNKSRILNT